MPSMNLRRLMPILLTLFCVIAIRSQETATTPKTLFAATSQKTAAARLGDLDTDCDTRLAEANARLLKALDAYDKAMALVDAKDAVIAAKDGLIALQKEAMAIKDQYIADVLADNAFLRKQSSSVKSKTKKFFEAVEHILLGAGIAILLK